MARKTKPTQYPHLPFHGLRTAQLVSSMVVMSILSYFLWHLHHDGYGSPWTFILLLTVSVLTIASLSFTIVLHIFYGLNPRFNVVLNGSLLLIWTVGFALLSWWSSNTIGHACNVARWENDTGIMICQLYKALFAFAMVGFISTLAATLLDIYVFRRATALGTYNQMQNLREPDHKPDGTSRQVEDDDTPYDPASFKSPFADTTTAYDPHAPADDDIGLAGASRDARFHDANVSFSTPRPSAEPSRSGLPGKSGYAVPEEQFRYGG